MRVFSSADEFGSRSTLVKSLSLFVVSVACVVSVGKLVTRARGFHGDLIAYYLASQRLFSGENPYVESRQFYEYLYPPFFAFAIRPLTLLSPAAYAVAWGVLLGVGWVTSLWIIRLLQDRESDSLCLVRDVLPSVVVFRFILNGWGHGQVALFVSPMILAALAFERRGQMVLSSLCLAVGGAIKVYPLYLGLFYLAKRRYLGIFLLCALSCVVWILPAIQVGLERNFELIVRGFLQTALSTVESQQSMPEKCALVSTLVVSRALRESHSIG